MNVKTNRQYFMIFKNPYFFFSFLTVVNLIFYALTLFTSAKRARCDKMELPPKTRQDFMISLMTLGINILIAIPGYLLFLEDRIVFDYSFSLFQIGIEFSFLVLSVDVFMFGAHIFAHQIPPFDRFHRKHHTHRVFNELSLYVMHPIEAAALGLLFTILFFLYDFNIYSVFLFLFFNWIWGVFAHWTVKTSRVPFLFSNNQFHLIHHRDGDVNFGFYTVILDRLIRTLRSE